MDPRRVPYGGVFEAGGLEDEVPTRNVPQC